MPLAVGRTTEETHSPQEADGKNAKAEEATTDEAKADETKLLDRAGTELDSTFTVDVHEVHALLDRVSESWDGWARTIRDLRTTRESIGMGVDPDLSKWMPDTARVIAFRKTLSGFSKLSENEVQALHADSMRGRERDGYAVREQWTRALERGP